MQNEVEMLTKHIEFLRKLDTNEFYEKEENEVRRYAQSTVSELVQLGNTATLPLCDLLRSEFTWSCFFALQIFRETKDPSAVPFIIDFLKKESDDSMANEEAMFALQDIGDPSLEPLIDELETEFEQKKYNSYLVGSLTGIIGPVSYDFMVKTTKEYLEAPAAYKGWFHIDDFTYNFVKQERLDAVPLLRQILQIKTLTYEEKRELEDTIHALEYPESYQTKIKETVEEIKAAALTINL